MAVKRFSTMRPFNVKAVEDFLFVYGKTWKDLQLEAGVSYTTLYWARSRTLASFNTIKKVSDATRIPFEVLSPLDDSRFAPYIPKNSAKVY